MKQQSTQNSTASQAAARYDHAIVMGGSMAGLLAARVLSSHFQRVTLIERDEVAPLPEARKGQPQARHLHALLARGFDTLKALFPNFEEAISAEDGMILNMTDITTWYSHGDYRLKHKGVNPLVLLSRPKLEFLIRERVLALPNVELRAGCKVEGLLSETSAAGQSRVSGVQVTDRQTDSQMNLEADLVIDAAGRASSLPAWLEELGFDAPAETSMKLNISYATRSYKRPEGIAPQQEAFYITPDAPHEKRGAIMCPLEGNRWMVTLIGMAGEPLPTDGAGFDSFVRSLKTPDIANALRHCEAEGEPVVFKYATNRRRHYETLKRFPEGLLALGDAVCSFNPVYGQGMTSAILQAETLERLLAQGQNLSGLSRPYFRRVAQMLETPWSMARAEDFRYPETIGKRPFGTRLMQAYTNRVHKATHHDAVVYSLFVSIMNLKTNPMHLFRPDIMARIFRPRPKAKEGVPTRQELA